MKFIFIYVTAKDKEEAKKISKNLLEKKLIACSNYYPVDSMYIDSGDEIRLNNEYVLILKSKEDLFESVKKEIKTTHSYDTPCIVKLMVEPNEAYSKWLAGQLDTKSL